ncbi:hypothetical protein [Methylotetracoccus oryzae]|uniref:hypothetical protein n=1 Tax=Methylotetracoccus oryzae TaxID=1919059 RepID=UPI001117EF0B|nr:hypothetical protein [Methylotetracoccus oryzae]
MNKNLHERYQATAVYLFLGLLLLPLCTVSADPPPRGDTHGNPYGQLAASWWSWALETPVVLPDSHPGFDQGSVDCSIGQHGQVWFLAGKIFDSQKVNRSCSLPMGKGLFFPLYNNVYINFATDPPLTSEVCYAFTQSGVKALGKVKIEALLDGKPLNYSQKAFEQSPIFSVQMPEPTDTETNLLAYLGFSETEFPDWVASANCDFGWYGYVAPLSPGRHSIKWKVASSKLGLLQDVEYKLTVLPRGR